MDGRRAPAISPHDLDARLGTAASPIVIDVRRAADLAAADSLTSSASHRAPEEAERWRHDLPRGRAIVAYCVRGHQVSQGATAALRAAGIDAVYLDGGIAGWIENQLPTRRKIGASPGKWVTREHPKIDRIACPWLIRRFVDPKEFIYVPTNRVLAARPRTRVVGQRKSRRNTASNRNQAYDL